MINEQDQRPHPTLLFRLVTIFDLLLIALSFTTWFSGNEHQLGAADRLFRSVGGDGFRVDFIFVMFWNLPAAVYLLALFFRRPLQRRQLIDGGFCVATLLGTLAYLHHILFAGLLDFG